MATLTFSLASTPLTGSKNFTLSDADVTRWISAYRKILSNQGVTGLTDGQVLARWADAVVAYTVSQVKQVEQFTAASPIDVT